jgi:regulatory protein
VNGSAADAPGERLAKVSYFPGVVPPEAEPFAPARLQDPVEQSEDKAIVISDLAQAIDQIIADTVVVDEPESPGERSARAANVSMHALARRGMSSSEMTALLRSRELDAIDVETEVARLERVGLLDDLDLASNLVRTLHDRKGLGRSAITAELRRRKIDGSAIERALSELDGDDELSRAREIATKRAPQLRSLDSETARRRLGAFLMRKGYSGSVVSAAVASALSSGGDSAGHRGTGGPRFE